MHGNLQHATKHTPGSITYFDVIKAAASESKDDLIDQLKLIEDKDASAAAWLRRKPPAAWVRYAMIESGISPHKYKTNQAVEATNGVYKSARKKDPFNLVHEIMDHTSRKLERMRVDLIKSAAADEVHTNTAGERGKEKPVIVYFNSTKKTTGGHALQCLVSEQRILVPRYEVTAHLTQKLFRVRRRGPGALEEHWRDVDLDKRYPCACYWMKENGLPCRHLWAVLEQTGAVGGGWEAIKQWVPKYYLTSTWEQAFKSVHIVPHNLSILADVRDGVGVETEQKIVRPPILLKHLQTTRFW